MKKVTIGLVVLFLAIGLFQAFGQSAVYTVTGPASVKAGGAFNVTWSVVGSAVKAYDTIAMCDASGRWLSYAPTGGLATGRVTFVAASVPVLTIKYFKTGYLGRSINPSPAAVTWVYVIP